MVHRAVRPRSRTVTNERAQLRLPIFVAPPVECVVAANERGVTRFDVQTFDEGISQGVVPRCRYFRADPQVLPAQHQSPFYLIQPWSIEAAWRVERVTTARQMR